MWQDELSRDVHAPPDAVWAVLADVERWPEWSPGGGQRIEVVGDDGSARAVGAGTRFRMFLPDDRVLHVDVVAFVPEREFTDVTEVNGITVRTEHLLEPHGEGTRITYRAVLTGDVPSQVLAETGAAALARVPDLVDALAERALSR